MQSDREKEVEKEKSLPPAGSHPKVATTARTEPRTPRSATWVPRTQVLEPTSSAFQVGHHQDADCQPRHSGLWCRCGKRPANLRLSSPYHRGKQLRFLWGQPGWNLNPDSEWHPNSGLGTCGRTESSALNFGQPLQTGKILSTKCHRILSLTKQFHRWFRLNATIWSSRKSISVCLHIPALSLPHAESYRVL